MKLNSIRLEPSVIATVYKRTLVASGVAGEIREASPVLEAAVSREAGVVPKAGKSTKRSDPDAALGSRELILSGIETSEATPRQGSAGTDFLGLNKRSVLILVNFPEEPFMPKEEQTFLVTILSACQLRLEDVAIVNRGRNPLSSFKDLVSHLKCDTVLLLGVSPAELELPVDFPLFQVQGLSNRKFLYAPPVTEIKSDKILKSKLWVCLQKLFNL